jgi:DNA (cytosine-5)-methyltransferase 1
MRVNVSGNQERPKLLDLYCCQGGAGMGYSRAGFRVIGYDLFPQPRYPFEFHQADAIEVLRFLVQSKKRLGYTAFAAAHASPPCQAHTNAQKIRGNEHPELVEPTRELLIELEIPYVIENVPGAPLIDPFELCGAMFGLGTYRHRLFETNFEVNVPEHPQHVARTTKMGRAPVDGEMMHVVGNFSGVAKAKKAMGIDWMTRDGLRESIPPAYTSHIGDYLMAEANNRKEMAA